MLPKTVLAIHDLPGFGRAALSVIVPVLSCLGVQAVALPTAVLSSHTGGLGTPAKMSNPGYGPAALAHYHRLGLHFDCIYSGYLSDPAQAKLVEQAFELWPQAFKVVDPVLGDGGRLYKGLGAEMVPAMYNLCSKADLITPNVTEAALLLGDPLPGGGQRRTGRRADRPADPHRSPGGGHRRDRRFGRDGASAVWVPPGAGRGTL